MKVNRRGALLQLLFGAGLVGLRSLATGIPAAVLLDPRTAGAAPPPVGAQFLLFSTSSAGDPVNCNAPGTYDDPAIGHPNDPSMAATPMALGGKMVKGAQIWSTLPAAVLQRMCFFHHATYTVIHPDEGKVLRMMGAVASGEMLPSMLSRELATALGTVRAQPISLGGDPNETIYFQGAPQPILTATTLANMLSSPTNGLGAANLLAIRDKNLDALNAWFKSEGTRAQKDFIDQYATSRDQLRSLQEGLLASLSTIKDDSADSQIQAAIILFQMKVTPVVTVHVPFGGDNHDDEGLGNEVAQHQTGVATLAKMATALGDAKLQDKVTFAMTNVFGRTMVAADNLHGRQHLESHHVSLMIGAGIAGSVVGGAARPAADKDFAATPIDSITGVGSASGDISHNETFASMGKTLAAAVGLSTAVIDKNIVSGKAVKAALVAQG